MTRVLQFGSKRLEYTLAHVARKTLGIAVLPDGGIIVRAPLDASYERIEGALRKRTPWIIKQQSFFLQFQPRQPSKKFVSGETHLYLGRQYRLKVVAAKKAGVHFTGRHIEVQKPERKAVQDILSVWYRLKAKEKFAEIAEPLIFRFKKYDVEPEALFIQDMPTRWGSCTAGGKIILNPELIKAPKQCIEYVIVHELCHLVHHNHTRKFFKLQSLEMPDWEKWKEKLETLLA